MATTSRQTKPPRKGGPDTSRRPAWTGARASPTFSPSAPPPRPQSNAPTTSHAPATHANGARPDHPRDRILQSLAGLTGTTVTLTTKTAVRYEGVIASTTAEGDTMGVTLKDAKDLATPGAPLKDSVFIASTNIESYTSGPADSKPANGDTFRTDTDIGQKKPNNAGRERTLQAWRPDEDAPPLAGDDDDTFGAVGNTSWDQFAVNAKLFGVSGGFNEDEYTTKLDRSAVDFKERELRAQRLAAEILGAATSNPHVKEERGIDDSGANEEDKYGAVVRGQNAYIPPAARRGVGGALSPPSTATTATAPTSSSNELPKVSVNGPDGAAVTQSQSPPEQSPSPVPAAAGVAKDAPAAFRDFVTNEKQRLSRKRQALVKSEMDKRMAELVKFSQNFKLNKPIPEDLVPILAKDEEKQRLIKEKAKKDAESNHARAIGASTAVTASRVVGVAALKSGMKPAAAAGIPKAPISQTPSITAKPPPGPTASKSDTAVKKIPMVIQPIPPFKGSKKQSVIISGASSANGASANGNATPATATTTATASPAPVSPTTTSANRLNVNASSFKPNLKANAFTPGASPNTTAATRQDVASPKPKQPEMVIVNNPFFGVRPIKRSSVTHIKDDFNPLKHNKVVEPNQIGPQWPYHGKRYAALYPNPPHQPLHQAHMVPPTPPQIAPPPYEEESTAQRGYVYPYTPYGYPAQPMMPGMAPPGPPGAYMPGPFMQPMPYPPGMPPPNAMYSPAMGQMPPYMPPPPGAYPPPPNGAGPRPSMPPTPIPTHAHPYYHQSPQLQHAVPYSMMMPPPTGVPHPYESGPPPPVQMGGHA